MKTLEQIVTLLADRNVSLVAERTGLSRQTVAQIKNGEATNPNYETLKTLSDYFEGQEEGRP